MKTLDDIKLESTIHNLLVRTTRQAIEDFVADDRDAEDGIWPDLSDHLEAVTMTIIKEVKDAKN